MVPPKFRLPSAEFRSGKYRTARTPYFSLKAKENLLDHTRVGIVVSVSVHKSAAKRNFWKRQARAALQAADQPGKDILLVLFPGAAALTKQKFRREVGRTLHELCR